MAAVDHDDDECERQLRTPLLSSQRAVGQQSPTQVYRRRWYVLAVFCAISFTQALIWSTWGPIAVSSKAAFGWNDGTIGMLVNYGNIAMMITVMSASWFMDVKGLRLSVILCCTFMLIGAALRCITLQKELATWFSNICAVLNGIAGTVPWAGPPLMSSTWFQPDQRATATAIISFSTYFGLTMSFIVGPQLVPDPDYENTTGSVNSSCGEYTLEDGSHNANTSICNMASIKSNISNVMYIHCGLAGIVFVFVVLYFPSKPPLPPSVTASLERTQYKTGIYKLLRNRPLWLIMLAYSAPTGVLDVWATVLDVNVSSLGISQIKAGWMGFWQTIVGCTAGVIIARFSDIFMKRMKMFLIVLFLGAIISTVWFTIICARYIPMDNFSLYTSCILIAVFINGAIPLFYEISCEASYPVAEGVTGGFLTVGKNAFGIVFLFMLLIPNTDKSWMNWGLLASVVFALPLLFLFPERYRRTNLDIKPETPPLTEGASANVGPVLVY